MLLPDLPLHSFLYTNGVEQDEVFKFTQRKHSTHSLLTTVVFFCSTSILSELMVAISVFDKATGM